MLGRRLCGAVLLALVLLVMAPVTGPGPLWAEGEASEAVDYTVWEKTAKTAEAEIEGGRQNDQRLEELRADLANWRNRLTTAQTANTARIATVKEQIAALGAPPADGGTEAPEIAAKRQELSDLLGKLQAPGLAAEEAYRRADGLIREIDKSLRDRQADQLLQLWPSPLNPGNWPEAAVGISDTLIRMWYEALDGWNNQTARVTFYDNLPLILLLLAVAVATAFLTRRWIEGVADRVQGTSSGARRQIIALLASLGQVLVPTLGIVALSTAAVLTGMLGELTGAIARALPFLGLAVFAALWLGGRTFPRQQTTAALLPLPPERRSEGRFESAMMGVVIAAEGLRALAMGSQGYSDAVTAVASYPIMIAGGILLWRMGGILRLACVPADDAAAAGAGATSYSHTIVGLLARACSIAGIAGPLLASFGYVAAGKALIFPAILTLALLALLLILQMLLTEIWNILSRADTSAGREGLVPVLLGFGLTVLALPVLSLIWGARLSDLTEVWTRFREGFQLGETRISPTDFLLFAVLFGFCYMVTRLFQGALRTTILPRTKMDRGGQNALVSGAGYVGIFLSALIAINATGIDLSGLAIVASALSVGIGFGLQNIVQNFVSGIILMIERPVSEGDWISVGTTEGIVKTISVRSTKIQTFDRSMVVVPNADLVSQRVTNLTRFSLAGRLIVPVTVAWGQDTRKIEAILREVAEAQAMVVLNPPPSILLQSFAAGVLNFEIRVILRDVNFSGQVKNDINHQLVERFVAEEVQLSTSSAGQMSVAQAVELSRALQAFEAEDEAAQTADATDPTDPADPTAAAPRHAGAKSAAKPAAKPAGKAVTTSGGKPTALPPSPSDETT